MGKNKLQKFKDMETYPHVFQFPFSAIKEGECRMKGKWKENFFRNNHPIILELGCGKGEYTVNLAKKYPDKNYIGIDIKGARMWTGAKQSITENLTNVAFLRTNIELLDKFFEKAEVSEIWITFPDPQMNKINKRLTSSKFLKLYSEILNENGIIHLKTDSQFMFSYTSEIIKCNALQELARTEDLYNSDLKDETLFIRTFYEQQWLERGINIKYIKFICKTKEYYSEPEIEIEMDPYRSYNRSKRSGNDKSL